MTFIALGGYTNTVADRQTSEDALFQEGKERARLAMLAVRDTAPGTDAQAVQTQQDIEDDDDEVEDEENASPSDQDVESDDLTSEEEDDDSDDDDEDDSDDDDETDDDESDDDEEAPPPDPKSKRKANRRSKKVKNLRAEVERLKADAAGSDDRLLKRFEEEQARRVALENEKRQREANDREIEQEMTEYLGSDQEYREAVKAALNGDLALAEQAKLWDERRDVFGKLTRRAEALVNQKAANIYWSVSENLPGVDKNILGTASFGEVLKHLHESGARVTEEKFKKELEKRDQKIARLEAKSTEKKVKKATSAPSPTLEGGTPAKKTAKKSIYELSMKPDGSIDREKFAALRLQTGRAGWAAN